MGLILAILGCIVAPIGAAALTVALVELLAIPHSLPKRKRLE